MAHIDKDVMRSQESSGGGTFGLLSGLNSRAMIVLVADKFEKSGIEGLYGLGADVLYEPDVADSVLEGRLKDSGAEVLVVRSTKVTREMIVGSKLKLIVRAGAGYNTIDVNAATEAGVQVANCPGKNAAAVAELAFGLMIALDRRIPDNVSQLREGRWNKKEFSKANGLADSTLGLIGSGNIAREMIVRAKAFGMHVIVSSKFLDADEAARLGVQTAAKGPVELAGRCDIVSVHCSLREDTRGLCGTEFFDAMKPGALFINTSRAEVVDQAALLQAIETKGIRAGLDVFEGEPTAAEGDYDGPLRTNSGIYATHHIGASTNQAQEAVAAETVRIVQVFGETGEAPNRVN